MNPTRCYRCGAKLGEWTDSRQAWHRRYRLTGRGYRCEDRGACAGRRARQTAGDAGVDVDAPTLEL